MNHKRYKGFGTAFWKGIPFLFLRTKSGIEVYHMENGELHNWGLWMSRESFKKRLLSKKEPQLQPLD